MDQKGMSHKFVNGLSKKFNNQKNYSRLLYYAFIFNYFIILFVLSYCISYPTNPFSICESMSLMLYDYDSCYFYRYFFSYSFNYSSYLYLLSLYVFHIKFNCVYAFVFVYVYVTYLLLRNSLLFQSLGCEC